MQWRELVERCPELAELADDARSIARHARWDWYEDWIGGSTIFSKALYAAAARLGVAADDIRSVARAGLVDTYRTAKERLQRKGRQAMQGDRLSRSQSTEAGAPRKTAPRDKMLTELLTKWGK